MAEKKIKKEELSQKEVKEEEDEKMEKKSGSKAKKEVVKENKTEEERDSKEDKKAKLAKILEKAKKLEKGVEEAKDIDLKKKIKGEEERKEDTLVSMEDYLKSSIHLGTRVITPDMRKFVYRRRADGLAVFNTALLDSFIIEGADYLAQFAPENVVLVCKREAGWKAVKKFSEILGIKAFTKKYPAGILTNTKLENFMETELVFICDPWLDKNALQDANRIKIPVLALCDTNNFTRRISKIIPGNNKSAKSIGMILYLLAKLYIMKRNFQVPEPKIEDFIDNWDQLVPPK